MNDELAKSAPKIQADNQSIAISEINITDTVTGNITIGHTIVQPAPAGARLSCWMVLWLRGFARNPLARSGVVVKKIAEKAKEETK